MDAPNKNPDLIARNFPTAEEDAAAAEAVARYAGPESSYRLAFTDTEFLLREEMRPVRMQLELLKPEMVQREQGIASTIVLMGSARILPPETAADLLTAAQASNDAAAIRRAQMQVLMSRYYEEARRFATLVTEHARRNDTGIVIVTGGGPGIMEAGNRGAHDAGGKSVGLNIVLPVEQSPNAYITPELCFQFHYFALRKMHFLMRSIAVVFFPGGFGTMDEMFEVLTLIQTGKSRKRPLLLVGREFWKRLIDFDWLIDTGMISPGDTDLFHFVETADEAWALLQREYGFDLPPTITGEFAADI